jgi:hypothetical protein
MIGLRKGWARRVRVKKESWEACRVLGEDKSLRGHVGLMRGPTAQVKKKIIIYYFVVIFFFFSFRVKS